MKIDRRNAVRHRINWIENIKGWSNIASVQELMQRERENITALVITYSLVWYVAHKEERKSGKKNI